jgi:hypothetical protein
VNRVKALIVVGIAAAAATPAVKQVSTVAEHLLRPSPANEIGAATKFEMRVLKPGLRASFSGQLQKCHICKKQIAKMSHIFTFCAKMSHA